MASVASFKDRLSRIALEVRDAAEELDIPRSQGSAAGDEDGPVPGRRRSSRSPVANGIEAGSSDEIARYLADIQKLKASEAEIKALSFNYAAILKEKEEQLSKLREENSSLRTSLDANNVAGHNVRDENHRRLPNSSNLPKGTADQTFTRPKHTNQVNSRNIGNYATKGNPSRQDGFSNGSPQASQYDAIQQMVELKSANLPGNGKEHTNMFEESQRSLLAVQVSLESEIKQLKIQLDNERASATNIKLQLQEEQRLNESSQKGIHNLKNEKERMSIEIQDLQKELSEKIAELGRQHVESNKKNLEGINQSLEDMKDTIKILENENAKLKIEKDGLAASLEICMKDTSGKLGADYMNYPDRKSGELNEVTEKMTLSIKQLEDSLRETCKERDKAQQELARLKQHLLEKSN